MALGIAWNLSHSKAHLTAKNLAGAAIAHGKQLDGKDAQIEMLGRMVSAPKELFQSSTQLTGSQAAKMLGVSATTIHSAIRKGQLGHQMVVSEKRKRVVDESSARTWAEGLSRASS